MAYGVLDSLPPPPPPSYKLFITHAWDHQEYDALVELIRPDTNFRWENLSVPKEAPIPMLIGLPKSIRKLVHELDDRIRHAYCVVIITGMYVAHRQWIQAPDLFRWYQMLLNGGTLNGCRYLSAQSVATMRQVFTPDVKPSGWLEGTGYGLTFEVVDKPEGTLLLHSPGTFGHGCALGTEGWMDPKNDLV